MTKQIKNVKIPILLIVFSTFTALSFNILSLKVNTTTSLPYGIYKLNKDKITIQKKDLVLFCLNKSNSHKYGRRGYLGYGHCNLSLSPIGKQIVATPGDDISVSSKGIIVNNNYLPNTQKAYADVFGNHLTGANIRKILDKDEYLVASFKENSFDSRYFGIVRKKEIIGKLKAIYTV